jgi:hypothetical protein
MQVESLLYDVSNRAASITFDLKVGSCQQPQWQLVVVLFDS